MTHRRLVLSVLLGLLVPLFANAANFTKGTEVEPFPEKLGPGDYVWHPEISPAGPVVVVVTLPDQQLYVFRNGVRIGRSTVSTGKKGKRTPTGRLHHPTTQGGPRVEHLQRGEDAAHAAADVGRHRHPRGTSARLPRVGGVRARSGGLRREALRRD